MLKRHRHNINVLKKSPGRSELALKKQRYIVENTLLHTFNYSHYLFVQSLVFQGGNGAVQRNLP